MITQIDNFDLLAHNTFRISATARLWIDYTSATDLPEIISSLGDTKFRCIGQGSNMLFTSDYEGALLHSSILDEEIEMTDSGVKVRVGSGVDFDSLVESLASAGIWGLENLSYIPGDAGSAAVQNIGAYGVEIKDFVSSVECYDVLKRQFVTLPVGECDYAYRYSIFKSPEGRSRYIVCHLNLIIPNDTAAKLTYGNLKELVADNQQLTPMDVRNAIIEMRRKKLPEVSETGSAGSFFMNPVISVDDFQQLKNTAVAMGIAPETIPHYQQPEGVKIPAAWLIEKCGLKGCKIGGAAVWHNQPLVLVNATCDATAQDILNLEHHIIETVNKMFNISLRPEVDHIN